MCVYILSLKNIPLDSWVFAQWYTVRTFSHLYTILIYNYCHQSTSLVIIHDEVLVAPKQKKSFILWCYDSKYHLAHFQATMIEMNLSILANI